MYHGELFLIAGLIDGFLCRRDKRRDEHRTAMGFLQVFLHFLLYLLLCQIAMAANLEALGICDEERVADGGIAMAFLASREIIDLAQPVWEMPLEPKTARVVIEIGHPGFQLALAKQDAVIKAAGEEGRFRPVLRTEVLRSVLRT